MSAPKKTDHATKTATLALAAARAAKTAADAAASSALAQAVAIARLEERQVASSNKFDTFYGAWCDNASVLRQELGDIKAGIANHGHPDVATKISDGADVTKTLTDRVNAISGDLRRGNIFSGIGIGLVAILSAIATYFDFHR